MRVALLACMLAACGRGEPTPKIHDARVLAPDAARLVTVETLPLGLPSLEAYRWRQRGGHAAFRTARVAEARQDWAAVVAGCREALAADPGHLEAAWLLAAALGRLGHHAEVLAPLQHAVAGDFGKWGITSLSLPALQGFLATPTGAAWRTRVEDDRAAYIAALARALVVEADGDLFAFDVDAARWHRVTRTYGAMIGAMRVGPKIIYVTRVRQQYAVGVADLARGRTSRPVTVGDNPMTVAYQAPHVWIGLGKTWLRLDDKLTPLPPKTKRPSGAYLDVRGRQVTLRARPSAVTADWDDHGLASAFRIRRSKRIVAVPSPGLVDGNTVVWSADRTRLAFVAQLTDECTPDAITGAAFVADAATGEILELERAAHGLAVEWLTEHRLAIAGDTGVTLHDLDAGTRTPAPGARGLATPKQRPACTAAEPDVPDPEPAEPELVEPVEAAPPSDAGGH